MGRQLISFISQEVGNGLNPEEAVFALITEIKSLMGVGVLWNVS